MNQEVEKAIHIAKQIAEEYQHENFGPPHLVRAALNRDLSLLRYFHGMGVDVYFIEEWADVNLENYPKRSSRTLEVRASSEAKTIFAEAEQIQMKLDKMDVDLVCLLVSSITPGVGFNFDQLKSLPVTSHQLLDGLIKNVKEKGNGETKFGASEIPLAATSGSSDILKKYTRELVVRDQGRDITIISSTATAN